MCPFLSWRSAAQAFRMQPLFPAAQPPLNARANRLQHAFLHFHALVLLRAEALLVTVT